MLQLAPRSPAVKHINMEQTNSIANERQEYSTPETDVITIQPVNHILDTSSDVEEPF